MLAFPLGFLLTGYHGADNFVSTAPVSVTGEGYVAKAEKTSGGYPKLTVHADLTESETGGYHGADNFVSTAPVSVTGEGYVAKAEKTSGGYPKLTVHADLTESETGEVHKNQKIYMIDMNQGTFTEGEEIIFFGNAQPFDHGDIFSGYNEYLYRQCTAL